MPLDPALLGELGREISRHAVPVGEVVTSLPGVMLMSSIAATEPAPYVAEPCFAMVVQGMKRVCVGERVFDYGAGEFLVLSVDLPLTGHIAAASPGTPFLGLGMRLDPVEIAALLVETGAPRLAGDGPPGMAVAGYDDDLARVALGMLRLLDRPEDIPALAPALKRELLWRLVTGPHGALVRQIGLADSRMAQVGRAVRFIREHFAEVLRVEAAAEVAGMSVTSFHRHFRRITAMTPVQYQKQIRLQAARARLMASPEDVAVVGFAVGYDSPSQFSREYRRQFGRPPGADRLALRDGATVAAE